MDNIQEINHRNTITIEQVLKDMDIKILSQQIRINGLNAAISTTNERINQLEQMVFLQKVQSTGRGPSVK